jgi:hypothetical protein
MTGRDAGRHPGRSSTAPGFFLVPGLRPGNACPAGSSPQNLGSTVDPGAGAASRRQVRLVAKIPVRGMPTVRGGTSGYALPGWSLGTRIRRSLAS